MSIKAEPSFSLADQLFNAESVERLARAIAGACPGFEANRFAREVLRDFPAQSLKQRIDAMVTLLDRHLAADFDSALGILRKALPRVALHVHFLKANGSHAVKVFNVRDCRLQSGEVIEIDKRQAFKPITTRTLYPGRHYAELVVNGVASEKRAFELLA